MDSLNLEIAHLKMEAGAGGTDEIEESGCLGVEWTILEGSISVYVQF